MEEHAELSAGLEVLRKTVQELEQRLSGIEQALEIPRAKNRPQAESLAGSERRPGLLSESDEALEYRIGEFWLGEVGLVALLLGIAFFISYPFASPFAAYIQVLTGYASAAGLVVVSRRFASTVAFTARMLFAGGLILLYYSTLRLHFFTEAPLLQSKPVALLLLTGVTGLFFIQAHRRGVEHLAVLACLIGYVTVVCSDTTHFALLAILATSLLVISLSLQHGWWRPILLSATLAYFVHLGWLFNNPLIGHSPGVLEHHHQSLVYLVVYTVLFGAVHLHGKSAGDLSASSVLLTLVNCGGFFVMGNLLAVTYFRDQLAGVNLLMAAVYLLLATGYWLRRQSRLSTAAYACFGYVALSVAIVSMFGSPARFVWLGWQSLLVICTAIWYRSRIIVVTNVVIYLATLLVYLVAEPPQIWVNLSYAAVGLLSARVMNWQKERLTLRTEWLRNSYLVSAFVVVPYGLHHGIPQNYVSLAWLGVAGLYFILSILLSNRKYRWMAILTMLLTVIRVFAIDLGNLGPVYRIVSFTVLGVAMLLVSTLYARYRREGQEKRRG